MVVKCVKCGANIPDGAAFCPMCGSPKPSVQSEPQMIYQPKPSGASSLQGAVNTVFSKLLVTIGIGIALLLAWIGKILTTFTSGALNDAGTVLTFTGLSGAGFILLTGGFLNRNFDKYIRLGMILTGGLMIVFSLIFVSSDRLYY